MVLVELVSLVALVVLLAPVALVAILGPQVEAAPGPRPNPMIAPAVKLAPLAPISLARREASGQYGNL